MWVLQVLLNFVAGRYAVRYGKVAGEVLKKQMAQIPNGLVWCLFLFYMSFISYKQKCMHMHADILPHRSAQPRAVGEGQT